MFLDLLEFNEYMFDRQTKFVFEFCDPNSVNSENNIFVCSVYPSFKFDILKFNISCYKLNFLLEIKICNILYFI